MGITEVTAYVIKMASSPTTIFVSFNVRLIDFKLLFELSAESIYCCLQLLHSTKYITLQELQCNSPLTKYFLPVTVQVNVFKNHIIVADVITITTNDAIAFSTFPVRKERWRQ